MIGSLQMKYNRGRQAAITNELVDIITGSCLLLNTCSGASFCRTQVPVLYDEDLNALGEFVESKQFIECRWDSIIFDFFPYSHATPPRSPNKEHKGRGAKLKLLIMLPLYLQEE